MTLTHLRTTILQKRRYKIFAKGGWLASKDCQAVEADHRQEQAGTKQNKNSA